MELSIENLSKMTPEQEKRFFEQFEKQLDNDTGDAAKAHLAAGRSIYYEDPKYPDELVKEYPSGKRQIVDFDMKTGEEILIREL
jgi:hypothetical protein